jgi:5-methylcytosine-specific restriction protein A
MPMAPPTLCSHPGCGVKLTGNKHRCEKHKLVSWVDSVRKSRHERGYDNDWLKLRKRIMQRDIWQCQPCKKNGRLTIAEEVDHIICKAHGGTNDEDNLQAICKECHKTKTAKEKNS